MSLDLSIVCRCYVVREEAIRAVIRSGEARNVAQVSRATNAGRHCGGCVNGIRRLLREETGTDPLIAEREAARQRTTAWWQRSR